MKLSKRRFLSLFLAGCTLLGCLLPGALLLSAAAAEPEFPNTYANTGNQRQDVIGVGLTQIGFEEGPHNRTKYGSWYAAPNQPWCATFVSWVLAQAELSKEVVTLSCISDPTEEFFNIPYYDGNNYTPKPGDLFYSRSFGHVGIVYYVEGEYFYTIEGNTNVHDVDNPQVLEGLYVMTNKRRIRDYIFGVPNYKSDDKDHAYVKHVESAHPHKTYYECTLCGYRYDSGGTEIVETCSKCLPCACYGTTSGYYKVDLNFERLGMSDRHGEGYRTPSSVPDGTIVYMYGYKDGWAMVNHDNTIAHIQSYYLKKLEDVPEAPTLESDMAEYVIHDNATVSWNAPTGADSYQIRVYKDCTLLTDKDLGNAQSYELKDLEAGTYEIRVIARNETGHSEQGRLQLLVRDVYRVKYDWVGGYEGPQTQTQTLRQVMTLSDILPTYPNYTCLGWTDTKGSNFVVYRPGDSFISDRDVTLYAVWKKDSATLKNLSIDRLPAQTRYLKGDQLNTDGLTLRLDYSDGSGELTTEGFTVEGFTSDSLGTKTVTVAYGDKTVTFDVQIMTYIPGDVNEDRLVDRDDVMQLLWHISFPDRFPISVPADFKEDGQVNRDDVMQLLWHVAFPDKFPLATVPDEEEPEPPAETTEPSTETTAAPEETTEPSSETTEAPEETAEPSSETTEAPEETTASSTETTAPPTE